MGQQKRTPRQRPYTSTSRVRDGLPTLPELKRAMRLLQMPVDDARLGIGADGQPPARETTILLALIATWSETYLHVWRAHADPMDTPTYHDVLATADREAGEDVRTLRNLVRARSERTHAAAYEAGQASEGDPFDLSAAVCALTRAAGIATDAWARPYEQSPAPVIDLLASLEGIVNDEAGTVTRTYLQPDMELLQAARDEAAKAIEAIDALLVRRPQ